MLGPLNQKKSIHLSSIHLSMYLSIEFSDFKKE